LAKTGGLADVSAALPVELRRRGHDVRVFLPLYRRIRRGGWDLEPVAGLQGLSVELGRRRHRVGVVRVRVPGREVEVLALDCPELYDREGIYGSAPDEHRRFAVLARGALAACQAAAWSPDVVHANDWHAALLPLYVRLLSSWDALFARTRTVLTIHNVGYQGVFGRDVVDELGLDDAVHLLHQDDLASGRVSFLKTGILYADVLTTVSRTHAAEIQTEELGMGLHELLRARADHLVGIVNGVDYSEWSPESDAHLPARYSLDDLAGKATCGRVLRERMQLAPGGGPTFGIVSRLVHQKGFELLFEPLPELVRHRDVRLAVLGSGEPQYEGFFTELARRHPERVGYSRAHDEPLAHLITAGSDFFLMPSRYEPCGLNQMYSLRYGTLPIVRKTGGLADTVVPFDRATGEGTGIVFEHFDAPAVRWALGRALEIHADAAARRRAVANAMAQDFSWARQAGLYEELYRRLTS
jgi:starch synthase